MPIRAYCTICSDFFDNSRDVAAIHCGHTFHYECLLQWFQTAPNRTCPQCRKQVSTRHIISKLFFDVAGEEESCTADPERLLNELDRVKALLTSKEKDTRDKQKMVEALRETVEKQKLDLESVKKVVDEKDKLCSALRKQMKYLENQQSETWSAKEEAQRLRTKLKTFESLDLVLQGQQAEVEAMIMDMGVGHSAVEQLSIYCISLKKEYENLKASHKSSNEMCEKLKKELFAADNKLQRTTLEMNRSKEEIKAIHQDLRHSDQEITSLKKKVEILQKTLSTPTRTNEVLSRLVLESPAPLELKQPHLHQPMNSEDIDLNMSFDIVHTPNLAQKKPAIGPTKKMRLEPTDVRPSGCAENAPSGSKVLDEDAFLEPFMRNSLLFRKKTFGSMLDPQRSRVGAVRTGYDGLGGRTKFIQPSPLSEIRPLAMKGKRKKVSRPVNVKLPTLDCFLE
ncbi:E3 ubiquitin-protein ligase TRAIP isoform X2 [Paramormyrops kingsleyae]|uniref:TRAF-interacting protein n=1 Tax=Paramormyrops kingsleyae TaxID=1676925 RepID=A0A3B3Q6H2_9TELE|nr:E3 ubiquitin-protein ligase TRAIP [Paramormyrops kingsleyae]XP_023659913.1 E3 ubiquitin-protein ligase TRAIP [Paramormyrops kingsleyae]